MHSKAKWKYFDISFSQKGRKRGKLVYAKLVKSTRYFNENYSFIFFSSSEIYSFSLCSSKQRKLFGHISSLFCCLILFFKMNNGIYYLFIHTKSIFTFIRYKSILDVRLIPLSLNIISCISSKNLFKNLSIHHFIKSLSIFNEKTIIHNLIVLSKDTIRLQL